MLSVSTSNKPLNVHKLGCGGTPSAPQPSFPTHPVFPAARDAQRGSFQHLGEAAQPTAKFLLGRPRVMNPK